MPSIKSDVAKLVLKYSQVSKRHIVMLPPAPPEPTTTSLRFPAVPFIAK